MTFTRFTFYRMSTALRCTVLRGEKWCLVTFAFLRRRDLKKIRAAAVEIMAKNLNEVSHFTPTTEIVRDVSRCYAIPMPR